MAQRTPTLLLIGLLVLGALLVTLVTPTRAADPTPLACPNGQTVFVIGRAPAREALLLFLGGRAVGGGLADASGAYKLPLRVKERPGSYPVEVRLRSTRAVVERFTCFVDIPLDSTPETPTAPPAASTPRTPTAQVTTPTRQATATPNGTAGTPSPSPTGPTLTPTITPTGPTATVTTTGTAGTPSPSPTGPTPTPSATGQATTSRDLVMEVFIVDPAFPGAQEEYVEIVNEGTTSVNLSGWRLINTSRSDVPPFAFPGHTLAGDEDSVAVFSLPLPSTEVAGVGEFYWNRPDGVWRVGDRAELRDARNTVVATVIVED